MPVSTGAAGRARRARWPGRWWAAWRACCQPSRGATEGSPPEGAGPSNASPTAVATSRRRRMLALAVGVDGVGQEDEEAVVGRVDPEHRAGEAGVAEGGARLEPVAAAGGVGGVDVEPVPAARRSRPAAQRGRSSISRTVDSLQNAPAVERAAVQDHPAEPADVVGGAENPRVPGHAAQREARGSWTSPDASTGRRAARSAHRALQRRRRVVAASRSSPAGSKISCSANRSSGLPSTASHQLRPAR